MAQKREPQIKRTHLQSVFNTGNNIVWILWEKTVSSASSAGKAGQLQHTLSLYTKITRHRKTPRREHRQNILWHKSYLCFFRSVSQGNRNNNKNKEKGPNQTYKLLHSKETINKTKRQPTEWEEILTNDVTNKGWIFKIYKQSIQLNKWPNPTMGRRPKHTFLQRIIQMANRHMKRCSTLLIY